MSTTSSGHSGRVTAGDVGLLLIRLGLGFMMAYLHGWPKIAAGPSTWRGIGGAMAALGITFWPVVWGFLAAFAQLVGSILLAIGAYFRIAAFLLLFTMIVAAGMHLHNADGLAGSAHAIEYGIVYLGLLIAGPGRLSAKQHVPFLRRHWFG